MCIHRLRLLGDSSRIVVAEDFHQRWNRLNLKCGPEQYTHTLVKIAKVHCKKCSFGLGVRYKVHSKRTRIPCTQATELPPA
ncbi:hypothetical protein BaRGS_00035414 [Batillaria attramentaria]|uniref:Uncharacterized protein n=1 Tax=Batillaria attramentaria TaxID=370345 RepID=A0ABD0JEF2_9CAEN